jgi:hypothetical protein
MGARTGEGRRAMSIIRLLDHVGLHLRVPPNWNRWWVVMWGVAATGVIVSAFFVPFWLWVIIGVVGLLVPELVSLVKKDPSLPPLTFTIRHFLSDFLAFPLIYFSVGAVGAHFLGFPRSLQLGALFALLGWLTDHFTVTYAHPDPNPFTGTPQTPETMNRMKVRLG